MSEEKTKQNLPVLGLEDPKGKTPTFGQRKLSPLRAMLDGKSPDEAAFGPVRVIKKELHDQQSAEEIQDEPEPYHPENTQRLVLSGETMRVNLERAARASELPSADDIPIVWGGSSIPAPNPNRLLGNPDSLPQLLRWLLVAFFLLSMAGSVIAVTQLLK
jgi:hypothetical protein